MVDTRTDVLISLQSGTATLRRRLGAMRAAEAPGPRTR